MRRSRIPLLRISVSAYEIILSSQNHPIIEPHPKTGLKLAAIDLGTNTFHMLLVEVQADGSYLPIERTRHFIKLAEDGIETIGKGPYDRGLAAMKDFRRLLDQHGAKQVRAIGTAALRTASNGPAFVQTVREQTGIEVELIDGNEEARLIYRGVSQALNYRAESDVIMDIGGGSVEFIFVNEDGVRWAQSFPVGVAVLRRLFHCNEPITDEEVDQLRSYLADQLAPVLRAAEKFQPQRLIGASGSFDVLEMVLRTERVSPHHARIDLEAFPQLVGRVQRATLEDRLRMENIPTDRADMIVVAFLLVEFIIQKLDIRRVDVVSYAMKEGILREMIDDYVSQTA